MTTKHPVGCPCSGCKTEIKSISGRCPRCTVPLDDHELTDTGRIYSCPRAR